MPRRQKGSDLFTHFVGFHVTETAYENLRREAALKGYTLSAYLRIAVEGRAGGAPQEIRLKGPDMSAQLEALARIGNNLNQIAHALNAGKEPDAAMLRSTR